MNYKRIKELKDEVSVLSNGSRFIPSLSVNPTLIKQIDISSFIHQTSKQLIAGAWCRIRPTANYPRRRNSRVGTEYKSIKTKHA